MPRTKGALGKSTAPRQKERVVLIDDERYAHCVQHATKFRTVKGEQKPDISEYIRSLIDEKRGLPS